MQSLYFGYCHVTKERKFTYSVSKESFDTEKRNLLKSLVARTNSLKTNLQKTPITIDEDLADLQKESEKELEAILSQMENIFSQVTSMIAELMNAKKVEIEEEVEVNPSPVKGKPGAEKKPDPKAKAPPAKKAPAKGAPSELAAYESTLPLTTSGIESVVIFIDRRIETLPFESL